MERSIAEATTNSNRLELLHEELKLFIFEKREKTARKMVGLAELVAGLDMEHNTAVRSMYEFAKSVIFNALEDFDSLVIKIRKNLEKCNLATK